MSCEQHDTSFSRLITLIMGVVVVVGLFVVLLATVPGNSPRADGADDRAVLAYIAAERDRQTKPLEMQMALERAKAQSAIDVANAEQARLAAIQAQEQALTQLALALDKRVAAENRARDAAEARLKAESAAPLPAFQLVNAGPYLWRLTSGAFIVETRAESMEEARDKLVPMLEAWVRGNLPRR